MRIIIGLLLGSLACLFLWIFVTDLLWALTIGILLVSSIAVSSKEASAWGIVSFLGGLVVTAMVVGRDDDFVFILGPFLSGMISWLSLFVVSLLCSFSFSAERFHVES